MEHRAAVTCAVKRDADWLQAAHTARILSWVSLFWMMLEGVVGMWAGLVAGSIALIGWALSSAVEGLASVIVIWHFSGARTMSATLAPRWFPMQVTKGVECEQ